MRRLDVDERITPRLREFYEFRIQNSESMARNVISDIVVSDFGNSMESRRIFTLA